MLALICAFLVLSYFSLALGFSLLRAVGGNAPLRRGDRLILSLWLGFAATVVLFLTLSLLGPLEPPRVALLGAVVMLLAGKSRAVRREIRGVFSAVPFTSSLFPACVLLLFVSWSCSGFISNRDAISYQYDIVHILSRIGVVPGLGLIHSRFGFVSSWFAGPAAFDHGILTARTGAIANGYALLLAAWHFLMVGTRIAKARSSFADWFAFAAIPGTLFFPLLLNYHVSPTPDFAVAVFAVAVTWSMLLVARVARADASCHGGRSTDSASIPLVLAALTLTFKLSALPLVSAAALFYVSRRRQKFKALTFAVLLSAALYFPLAVTATAVTGCPLYPGKACFSLPWSVDEESVHREAQTIRNYARWGGAHEPEGERVGGYLSSYWLVYWLHSDNSRIAGFFLLLLTAFSALWLCFGFRDRFPEIWPVMVTAGFGILFLVILAPDPRFGWSHLTAIPCLLIYANAPRLQAAADGIARRLPRLAPREQIPLVLALLLLILPGEWFETRSEKMLMKSIQNGLVAVDATNRLLLPREIPKIVYDRDTYLPVPQERLPGGERGMFYSLVPPEGVRYRVPEQRERGGYVRIRVRER
jgi:hypothetical protein